MVDCVVLLILDGWGIGPDISHNAITRARTPTWNKLLSNHPSSSLHASGEHVGLPAGKMGNSEVGHLTIGAGRVVAGNFQTVNQAIAKNQLASLSNLNAALNNCHNSTIHILTLLSDGGVHSHDSHLYALLEHCKLYPATTIKLHIILDGRDVPPQCAECYLEQLEQKIACCEKVAIASVMGRYYAMDRDKRWERTKAAYDLLVSGASSYQAKSAKEAVTLAYARNETDEFVKPTIIENDFLPIKDSDTIIFLNFRSDRIAQLYLALAKDDFSGFSRSLYPEIKKLLTLTKYDQSTKNSDILFPPKTINNSIGEWLATHELSQLRVAESEKFAHVTTFLNGGNSNQFKLEDRTLHPSPQVDSYIDAPEMAAHAITKSIIANLGKYNLIVANFANADMLGHTGDLTATINAIEHIDSCLQLLLSAIDTSSSQLIITADHGNAEIMRKGDCVHKAHTTSKVPLVYYGGRKLQLIDGSLADIAVTILELMGLTKPSEMTGISLARF